MATKKKTAADTSLVHPTVVGATPETHPKLWAEDGTPKTRETHPRLFNKDGSPIDFAARAANRRPSEVILAELQAKRAVVLTRQAAELAKLDKRINALQNPRVRASKAVDPVAAAEAAHEFLGKGMSVDQIIESAQKLALAAAGLKGKTDEEVEAIKAAPPAPAFLSVTMVPAEV